MHWTNQRRALSVWAESASEEYQWPAPAFYEASPFQL
jgi:hypothetical protein